MKYARKIGAVVASLALCAIMMPAAALAEPAVLQKTYQWTSLESQPAFPQSVTQDGQTYLAGTPVIKELSKVFPTVPATHTETRQCWPADLEATRASFAETYAVDEDDYAGAIPLTNVAVEPFYAFRQWEINEARTYAGLPSNDVAQLPQSIQVASSSTGNTLNLALASLSWRADAVGANGLPSSYTASAIYRGVDGETILDYYQITATWEGEVPAKEPVIQYQATVEYVSTYDGDDVQEEDDNLDLPLIAGVAAAAAAVGGFFFWRRGRDVKVCALREGKLKVVATVASKRGADGSLRIDLPPRVNLASDKVALILRKDKVNGGAVRITQYGTLIHRAQAEETIWLP